MIAANHGDQPRKYRPPSVWSTALRAILAGFTLLVATASLALAQGACPIATPPAGCSPLPQLDPAIGATSDIVIDECFTVSASPDPYVYRHINVVEGGALYFVDPPKGAADLEIDFRVNALLVEQGGSVEAGTFCDPFGYDPSQPDEEDRLTAAQLTIGLWGDDPTMQGTTASTSAIACQTADGQCYPEGTVNKYCIDSEDLSDPCSSSTANDVGLNAIFEGYKDLPFDNPEGAQSPGVFFGYKVLGVSYGGSLQLFGAKGVAPEDRVADEQLTCEVPADGQVTSVEAWAALSGNGWVRLAKDEKLESKKSGKERRREERKDKLEIDRRVDWEPGDRIVVATTDWHPSHSELVTVSDKTKEGERDNIFIAEELAYPHFAGIYEVPHTISDETGNPNTEVDLRAAVALLSRSITIESLGNDPTSPFPAAADCGFDSTLPDPGDCYFGGHVIARQGFGRFQIQGVEFKHLGQGGRMGHYPAHAHLNKSTAYTDAFVKDSAVWASNNRFIVLHGTHDYTLARNVGYLSVGHGYYLEDATEINNLLCYNLGISARGALQEYYAAQDPTSETYRYIPPILDGTCPSVAACEGGPAAAPSIKGDDSLSPVMFWAMNQQNEFVGNMAAGVHGFGSCFWLLGSGVSGASQSLQWTTDSNSPQDYAEFNTAGGIQAPLKRFRGNSCTTATYGLQTTLEVPPNSAGPLTGRLTPVKNPYIETDSSQILRPFVAGNFSPVKFGKPSVCTSGEPVSQQNPWALNEEHCVTTIIDRFTTSFNSAEVAFGSVWLRPFWYIFLNSAITDQLSGGLGFVGGGSWPQVPPAFFDLTKDSIFVGSTRKKLAKEGRFDTEIGPVIEKARCEPDPCVLPEDGTGIFRGGLAPKRMMTIYDGPFYSENSVFTETDELFCDPNNDPSDPTLGECGIYRTTQQPVDVPPDLDPTLEELMRVAHAAIGWKQPNSFFYPPAFAFLRSGFDEHTQRHYVLDQGAAYDFGSALDDPLQHKPLFPNPEVSVGITPVDVSTILNDLDGTLTGTVVTGANGDLLRRRTSSVSNNAFFDAPAQTPECKSFGVETSAYDFITTVVAKLKSKPESGSPAFLDFCTSPETCAVSEAWNNIGSQPGVPIYRQYLLPEEIGVDGLDSCASVCSADGNSQACGRATFMVGGETGAAPYLTANHGLFYIDTDKQDPACIKKGPKDEHGMNTDKVPQFHLPGFETDKSYVLFHLFASEETRVSYQLYVGESFVPASQGAWVRVFPHRHEHAASANSLLVVVDESYPGNVAGPLNGVITVTLDNTLIAEEFEFAARDELEKCMPRDICEISANGSGCVLSDAFEEEQLKSTIDEVCRSWVTATAGTTPLSAFDVIEEVPENVSLIECPAEGCLGYAFKLQDFEPKPYAEVGNGLRMNFPTGQAPGAEFWDLGLDVIDGTCQNSTDPVVFRSAPKKGKN